VDKIRKILPIIIVFSGCQFNKTYKVHFKSGCEGKMVKQCSFKGQYLIIEFVDGQELIVESDYVPNVKLK